jgi:two-component sensor histidine kinase
MTASLQTIEDGLGVREANHRMMNMLATLLAIFRRNFSTFSDDGVRAAAAKFEGQIIATSELLRTLSQAPTAQEVAIDVYLERLGVALSSAVLGPMNATLQLRVDQGRLPIDVAKRLGLVVVELVINASKYGLPNHGDGVVRVDMIRSRRNWRCLVSDNGAGMNGSDRGAGLTIVETLARSLNGRLLIRSGASGTCVCVVLPNPAAARARVDAAPMMAFDGGDDELEPIRIVQVSRERFVSAVQ